ncbi:MULTISPECIES: hypothetical protein [unclassified Pseudomonas]|uniref:hypothetical protein n=1 Tax=unclassified Pseudomonas TaxID=196821 RepID=UPI000C88D2FB|nr:MULTISPECIES: hypothetical protein [unclassified Pseudomonas]MEE5086703.1 hypothetical protein [Pseudomonas alliivorans]VVN68580.1 hypothetical protein PS834_00260 [Pseudomonas fluorescens]PMX24209.1 hypothetical protein C1Y23_16835 [Pseudomonas sp. GW460-12]PMX32694.1 hypothetical protein C1Y24_20295 [Pseudomonas sp. MPR-R2A4]PMX39733.1 hypothetical protein C1Y26_17505 [Pseudomonas sp. MPR-R2A7]
MDLKVMSVGGQGDQKSEYVALQATKDCNLNNYMIFDETYKDDGSASNKHRHIFIFPDWTIKKGEFIFLFTRPGSNNRGVTQQKNPASYFYWGLKSSVWNEEGDKVHIVKTESKATFKVPSIA